MSADVELVRFTQSLATATSLEQLERVFLAGFGPLLDAEAYGYELYDPLTGTVAWSVRANASELLAARVVEVPLAIAGRVAGRLYFTGRDDRALAAALAAVIAGTVERLEAWRTAEDEHPQLAPGLLAALTPREQQVAVLVVEGLADREIAERLCLSHHTVTQYVKRIYRKIEVDSRVGLTRLLLTARRQPSRSATIPPNTPR
jgi:DNA-binding CsgD family transcriptional regulator